MSSHRRTTNSVLKIGTRGSPLALKQAEVVVALLKRRYPHIMTETVIIRTSGDRFSSIKDREIASSIGTASACQVYSGKGLFVKEIEEALLKGEIDIAVHSLKDVPARIAKGLTLAAYLKRDDPTDIFISGKYGGIEDLPEGAVFGTSSPRRAAQLLSIRPDLKMVPLRGNIETRIKRLLAGDCDATILASAGLKRLGYAARMSGLRMKRMKRLIPAAGQGIITVEIRKVDAVLRRMLRDALNDAVTEKEAVAERAFLRTVSGDCHTPMAARAKASSHRIVLSGFAASPSGKRSMKMDISGSDAATLGKRLGRIFVRRGARTMMKKLVLVTGLRCDRSKYPGAKVVHLPLIRIAPPSDGYSSLDGAIRCINSYDWVVFTSRNAVDHFMKRFKNCNLRFTPKIAVVGPVTAERVRSYGLKVDLMPDSTFNSRELTSRMSCLKLKGRKVLFPRAKSGMDTIAVELAKMGAHIDIVEAYRTVPRRIDVAKWRRYLRSNRPDEVVFSSPSAERIYKRSLASA